MTDNIDFATFQKEVSWFIKPGTTVVYKEEQFRLSEEFKTTFPKLTLLVERSRISNIKINGIDYILFAWTTKENLICGWLNKIEDEESRFCELLPEHELLLRNIGGIQESFNQPDNSFTNNQNFIFLGTECSRGIGDWDDYYSMMCEDESMEQMQHAHLLTFAQEANGALTMYDPYTKKVLLFSHDHSFDNVNFIESQPKYTFCTFKNADTFVDYVEELANQWAKITVPNSKQT
ncbi:MAG: hypothetical protein K1X55_05465 [Chitinophagales bacterium]|nr:hypothetical protein [Chitinophagales bacterium]